MINGLPDDCPCDMGIITIFYEHDMDNDGQFDLSTRKIVGTYTFSITGGQLFSPAPRVDIYDYSHSSWKYGIDDRIIGDGEILIFDDLWEYYETRVSVNIDLDCNGDGAADCSAVISSEPLYTPCW